jgi:hypothetical protein
MREYTYCTRPSSDPASQGISRRGGGAADVKLNYRKQSLLLYSSHLMFHQSTHNYILPAALLHQKDSRGLSFVVFLNHALSAIQSQTGIA